MNKNFRIPKEDSKLNAQVNEENELMECCSSHDAYWRELLKYIDDKIQNKDPLYMMDIEYDEILVG
jgi:hypothetical protein